MSPPFKSACLAGWWQCRPSRQRQVESLWVQGQPDLPNEFQDTRLYKNPVLKKTRKCFVLSQSEYQHFRGEIRMTKSSKSTRDQKTLSQSLKQEWKCVPCACFWTCGFLLYKKRSETTLKCHPLSLGNSICIHLYLTSNNMNNSDYFTTSALTPDLHSLLIKHWCFFTFFFIFIHYWGGTDTQPPKRRFSLYTFMMIPEIELKLAQQVLLSIHWVLLNLDMSKPYLYHRIHVSEWSKPTIRKIISLKVMTLCMLTLKN